MTALSVYRAWYPHPGALHAALRTQYEYSSFEPGRATGWLYCGKQAGQLPVTPWPDALTAYGPYLLSRLEETTGTIFTAVCFQAYLDGTGCGWHHDRDWDAQAVLSLGVPRQFGIRSTGGEQFTVLDDGDLVFMPSGFQDEWEHCVPVEDVKGERCSLVFRSAFT